MKERISIQIVLVLYKTQIESCLSYQSLVKNQRSLSFLDYELLLYNNSPEIKIEKNEAYVVVNSENNDMLIGAYNFALKRAKENNRKWILLLDQDTELTEKYFEEIENTFINGVAENMAAIVPLFKKGVQISPMSYNPNIGPSFFLSPVLNGKTSKCIAAFNSGTLIKVEAISCIGGFPSEFPLDDLDTCYFYRLYKKGYSFQILDVVLSHDLSILDYKKNMNIERYKSIIDSNKKFAKEIGWMAVFFLTIRTSMRFIKQLFVKEKRKYAKETIQAIFKK